MEKIQPAHLSLAVESSCLLKKQVKLICNLTSPLHNRFAEIHMPELGTGHCPGPGGGQVR